MRFLVDAQLPEALVDWLIANGHEAEHVRSVNLGEAEDGEIWTYAAGRAAVIVSKDEDFALRVQLGRPGPAVVWIRVGNTRTHVLLERCGSLWPVVVAALDHGERLLEIS